MPLITRPDDFHLHLRRGEMLRRVLPYSSGVFSRALVMPNTLPPILGGADVTAYRNEILEALPEGHEFEPIMTLKLTDRTTPRDIDGAAQAGAPAAKLYPAGATTNSDDGVRNARNCYAAFGEMERSGMILCIHAEDPDVFVLERERRYLDTIAEIAGTFPALRIIIEHVSDAKSVEFVRAAGENIGATVTVHHLVATLDDIVGECLSPHMYCKPVPKTPDDRDALREVVFAGVPRFFFGSDSAPHAPGEKEGPCGAAGVFSAPTAIPILADLFEEHHLPIASAAGAAGATGATGAAGASLEAFTSFYGADFYGLPRNTGRVSVERPSDDGVETPGGNGVGTPAGLRDASAEAGDTTREGGRPPGGAGRRSAAAHGTDSVAPLVPEALSNPRHRVLVVPS